MHCYISQIEQLCFSEPLSSFDSIHFVGSTNESELAFGICEKISQVGSIRGKGMRGSKRRRGRRRRSLFWSGKEVAQGRAKDFGRLRTALENVKNMPLSVSLNFTVVPCRFSYKFPP